MVTRVRHRPGTGRPLPRPGTQKVSLPSIRTCHHEIAAALEVKFLKPFASGVTVTVPQARRRRLRVGLGVRARSRSIRAGPGRCCGAYEGIEF